MTGYDLVADTTIRLTFEDGNLSVNAGCNTMFAPYELTEDSLAWTGEPAATMMGCPDDLAAQDQWLAELFTTGVGAAADGPTLTLTSDDVTIVLSRAPEADLQELFGKTWSAVATIADGATSRIPRVVRTPRVVVGQNGLGRLDTGCNSGRTTVTADATSITFGHPAVTQDPLPGTGEPPSSNGCSPWWTAAATTWSSTGRCSSWSRVTTAWCSRSAESWR